MLEEPSIMITPDVLTQSSIDIMEKYGIKSQQTLEILDHKVKWNGFDPKNAELVKA